MIIPFSLVLLARDRFKGFLTVLGSLIGFHLILAVATQALHFFSYGLIISIHSLVALATLVIVLVKRSQIEPGSEFWRWILSGFVKRNDAKIYYRVNYFAIFAILIIVFQFWSVHYSYTGTISTSNGFQEVKNSRNIYPYYSDEWIGISLINYSIENRSLPLVNPLWHNTRFNNPTFPFFSFLAEVFLILQLNPLTTYPLLAILAGTLICSLTYLILRKSGAGIPASLLATLSIPYIINGANLPGLWYFLPLTAGLIQLLFALLSTTSEQKTLAIVFSILSIIFYPPIIAFSLPLIITLYLKDRNQKEIWIVLGALILVFLIALTFIFPNTNLTSLKDSITSFVLRTNLQNGIPKFNMLTIIPIWTLILAVIAIITKFTASFTRCKTLLVLTAIGLIFWTVYSGTQQVFIIEYQRVIVITSILITILAGLGFENIKNHLKISEKQLAFLILAIFAIASPFYTRYTDWQKLVMQIGTGENRIEVSPASPANIYLTQNNLELFKDIKGQRFIAPPWKGLVIGVATHNFPLESKPSTITNKILPYNTFLSATCAEKTTLAQKFQIAYAYSSPFICKSFTKIGESSEYLTLYKFFKIL